MKADLPTLLSFIPAAMAALAIAPAANAQDCSADADCATGFSCEVIAVGTCTDVACPENEPCPAPEPCEVVEYGMCVPGPCASDADCADGMLCHSETYETCSASEMPACAPGEVCPDIAPAGTCETVTHSQCVYPHELPCAADADCGTAFQCVETESCWCSGSAGSSGGGTDPAPDLAPAPPEEPTCGCSPSGEFQCVPREIPCSADTDCPSTWSCVEMGGGGYCEGAAPSPDGGFTEPVCYTEPSVMQCQPPTSGYYGYGSDEGGTGGESGGGTVQNPTRGDVPSEPPSDPAPEPPEEPNQADPGDDVATEGTGDSSDSGSCAVSVAGRPTRSGLGATAALLAGLVVAARRRRRAIG